jgi:C1A family cysteine protease
VAQQLKRRSVAWYGRIPDKPDKRDFKYEPPSLLATLPPRVDLRRLCPPPFDQGYLGSCTANAIAAALMVDLRKQRRKVTKLSRLFLYYHERVIEGTVSSDSGAQIRDGMKAAAKIGVCTEAHWPYSPRHFRREPRAKAYMDATDCRIETYRRLLPGLRAMKACLSSGYPFVFGFTVYEGFESAAVAHSGKVELPGRGERQVGGHAVLAIGYDDTRQRFRCLNSWGANWGDRGYFTIPYEYLTDSHLAGDFWTATTIAPKPHTVPNRRI